LTILTAEFCQLLPIVRCLPGQLYLWKHPFPSPLYFLTAPSPAPATCVPKPTAHHLFRVGHTRSFYWSLSSSGWQRTAERKVDGSHVFSAHQEVMPMLLERNKKIKEEADLRTTHLLNSCCWFRL